jgi:hypothetical protein
MTENQESGIAESKFMRVFLIIIGALFIFTGPTYIPYILADVLKANYIASIAIGFAVFIVGILIVVYLARKKIIT